MGYLRKWWNNRDLNRKFGEQLGFNHQTWSHDVVFGQVHQDALRDESPHRVPAVSSLHFWGRSPIWPFPGYVWLCRVLNMTSLESLGQEVPQEVPLFKNWHWGIVVEKYWRVVGSFWYTVGPWLPQSVNNKGCIYVRICVYEFFVRPILPESS